MEPKEEDIINKKLYEKAKKPQILISFAILLAVISLLWLQYSQVLQFGINNATVEKAIKDPFASFLLKNLDIGIAGFFVGLASLIMYRRQASAAEKQASIMEKQASASERNAQENQRIELIKHYSRAVSQLGNEKVEIRLGAISALESIANISDEYYWPIMETLTAYVRKNSSAEVPEAKHISSDIQAILTLIGKRKYSFNKGENKRLELQGTYLPNADLKEANLKGANFKGAHLERVNFEGAHLEGAILKKAHLEGAKLREAHLEGSDLIEAHLERSSIIGAHLDGAKLTGAFLEGANLMRANLQKATIGMAHFERVVLGKAHLEGAKLIETHLEGAYLIEAHLEGSDLLKAFLDEAILIRAHLEGCNLVNAHLEGAYLDEAHIERAILMDAHLKGACLDRAYLEGTYLIGATNLTIDQLSKVKTLYKAQLDKELCRSLKKKDPAKYQALTKETEPKHTDKKLEVLSVTYVYRRDPVTDELRSLTADEFQQLIDIGIDPKHTNVEEISILCGWLPAIKTHYYVKGQESFVTNEYFNWTSAYEANK